MKVFVLGTRGFPDIQGGVEQHCESLYTLLASDECLITVFRRKPFIVKREKAYDHISFIDLPSTRIPGFETFYHSFLSAVVCILKRPDIVHIHNIGPGFFVPLLKIFGLKVVMTYHSPNYEHIKWSSYTRHFLKFSEFLSTKYADVIIFVSSYQKEKLGNKSNFIHINNGVKLPSLTDKDDYIKDLGLINRKYILSVGRFVEEKGFDLLIRAYSKAKQKGFQLVIAGDSDHETAYSFHLKELAKANGVVLTGFIRGENLSQLYNHSGLFVLPSYNEGQPLSLLEAMSYCLPVLASDIPGNLQAALPHASYFTSGNELSLQEKLDQKLNSEFEAVNYDMTPYNWDNIALQTKNVYKQLLEKKRRPISDS